MSGVASQHPGLVAAVLIVCIIISGIIVIGAIFLGRSLKVDVGVIHAELKPNGGSSVRDAIDRIERKADSAVDRADIAATQATVAADKAADALERIERLEQHRPSATAIVVNPTAPDSAG